MGQECIESGLGEIMNVRVGYENFGMVRRSLPRLEESSTDPWDAETEDCQNGTNLMAIWYVWSFDCL